MIFVRCCNVSVLVPTEARCTFESGFCGWRNTSGEMSLTWKLYKGDRHKFTGPKWDNTFRNRTGNVTTRFGRQTKININNIFSPLFFFLLHPVFVICVRGFFLPKIYSVFLFYFAGTYAYVDMSGSSYLGATARMDSIHFHPPPTYCSDTQSKYYNSCYVSIRCIPIAVVVENCFQFVDS